MEFTRPAREMLDYINDRPLIVECLVDCWTPIQRIFGAGTNIHISLEQDPEEGSLMLAASIQWPFGVDEGREKLAYFDKFFWLARSGECSDLMFHLEFVGEEN